MKRGYLGVAGQRARLAPAQIADGHPEHGLLVLAVTAGGPAAVAGVLVGDVILDFEGAPIAASEDLLDALVGVPIGRAATLRVLRGRTPHELTVTVAERPQ